MEHSEFKKHIKSNNLIVNISDEDVPSIWNNGTDFRTKLMEIRFPSYSKTSPFFHALIAIFITFFAFDKNVIDSTITNSIIAYNVIFVFLIGYLFSLKTMFRVYLLYKMFIYISYIASFVIVIQLDPTLGKIMGALFFGHFIQLMMNANRNKKFKQALTTFAAKNSEFYDFLTKNDYIQLKLISES